MNVEFEKKDDLNALATVSILQADYQDKLNQQLKDYRKKAKIPGFRPGNAPIGMLKNMVGKSLLYDIVTQEAITHLYDYFKKENIDILAQPVESADVESDLNFDEFGDFTFRFDVALAPEFDIDISDKDVVNLAKVQVTDAILEDEIKMIQRQYGELNDIEEASSENDSITFLLTELNEDESEKEDGKKDVEVKILIEVVKDKKLQKKLLKLKKDDEGVFKPLSTLFNDNKDVMKHYFGLASVEDVDAMSNVFKYKVNNIASLTPAELNNDLYSKLFSDKEFKSEDEFRAEIKKSLEFNYEQQAKNQQEKELLDLVWKKHNIPLPDAFFRRWLLNREESYTEENVDERYAEESKFLRRTLIMDKVLKNENAEITEDDIKNASLSLTLQMFKQYGIANPEPQMLESMDARNRENEQHMNQAGDIAKTHKVIDILLPKITTNENVMTVDEFDDYIKNYNQKETQAL